MTPFRSTHHVGGTLGLVILLIEIALFTYFVVVNSFYIGTTLVALFRLPRFVKRHVATPIGPNYSNLEPPVTVAVPAFNEELHIVETVRSLLRLDYSEHEVIVVNDGSTDRTLACLVEAFGLFQFPDPYRIAIPTKGVRAIYISDTFPNLRVVDKDNGGKGDALNAAVNCARFPLIFACDADSHYSRDALQCMVDPFLNDPHTVACGAGIGVENDCVLEDGAMLQRRLSKNWLVRFQTLEYMRAFLSSRLGWAPFNALLIVSGACGLWRRETLLEAGGFRADTIWEDMEMTMRVHHMLRKKRRPYRIAFTPFSVCWTAVPDSLGALWNQRTGWHRHVSECMSIHRRMFASPRTGTMGFLGFPYLLIGEWLSPLMVCFGVAFGIVAAYFGFLSYWSQLVLLGLVAAFAIMVSFLAILLDEMSFRSYTMRELLILMLAAPLEIMGFRQIVTLANLIGFMQWFTSRPIRGRKTDLPGPGVRAYNPLR